MKVCNIPGICFVFLNRPATLKCRLELVHCTLDRRYKSSPSLPSQAGRRRQERSVISATFCAIVPHSSKRGIFDST